MAVLKEETQHLPRCVRSSWIGVGAGRTAARPGMACAVDDPLLENYLPARVGVKCAAIGMPAGDPAVLHCCLQVGHRGRLGLRDDLIAVARMNRAVLIPVEHDCRDHSPVFSGSVHGYGLARRIEQAASGSLALNQGTIYPALLRLEQKGWIQSEWGASENNRRARFYSITRSGRKQLAVEAESWARTVAMMDRLLREP